MTLKSDCARFAFCWFTVGIAVLALPCEGFPQGPASADGRQAKMLERDELWRQAQGLSKEGKHEEAVRAAEKVLELETELFGRAHDETAGTVSFLIGQRLLAKQYDRAHETAKLNLEINSQSHGVESWQAVHAGYYLDYVRRLTNLPDEVRDKLRESEAKYEQQFEAQQYLEAAKSLEQLARDEEPHLGEDHPFFANTFANMADAYYFGGEYASAETAARRCLAIRSQKLRPGDPAIPGAVSQLAKILYSQKNYAEAEAAFQKAAAGFDEAKLDTRAAWMHAWRGNCFQGQGDALAAAAALDEAAERFSKLQDDGGAAYCAKQAGSVLYSVQRYGEAGQRFAQAAAAYERNKDEANVALMLTLQGHCARDQQQDAQAVEHYRQALEIWRRAHPDQPSTVANTLANLGLAEQRLRRYADAESHLQEALEIRKNTVGDEHEDYAVALHYLGRLYVAMGEFDRAEPLYQQAAELARRLWKEDSPNYARSLEHEAEFAYRTGDNRRALEIFTEAAAVHRRGGADNELNYAQALENLSQVYSRQGDYAAAEPRLKEALKIRRSRATKACLPCASTSAQLAALYTDVGDFAQAELLYRQSLQMIKDASGEESLRYVNGLVSLAWMYYQKRDYAAAQMHFEQALALRNRLPEEKNTAYADLVYGLGSAYEAQHDFAQAEPLVLEAMEIKKRILGEEDLGYAYCLSCVQLLYTDMGEYDKAEEYCLKDLAIRRRVLGESHNFYAKSLNNLARIYRYRGDYDKAESLCREVLRTSREHAERTAAVQSERQQLATERDLRVRLDAYLSLAVKAGRFEEAAYRQVLDWKGVVSSRQRASRALAGRDDLEPLFNELQRASSQLATLALSKPEPELAEARRRQLADLAAEVERLEQDLASRSAAYRQAMRRVSLENLREALPDDAVLVDYLQYTFTDGPPPGDEGTQQTTAAPVKELRLAAFVVRREGPVKLVDLGSSTEIEAAIDAWRSDFGRTQRGAEAGLALRRQVWDPIERLLEESVAAGGPLPKTVLVSPDGALGRLPLAALPGKEPGSYLLEAWPIAVIAAPQILPELLADEDPLSEKVEKPQPPGNMLALGGVNYDSASAEAAGPKKAFARRAVRDASDALFTELPGAKGEIASIEKTYREVFGDAGILTLQGAAATEEALRREAPRHLYLHLATHGFFAAPKYQSALHEDVSALETLEGDRSAQQTVAGYYPGLLSGIALAGANHPPAEGDDGILTAEEVATLNLSGADLVVLSACETGLGEVADGEGLLGLQRAFQIAGARTVVASFWKVPDAATRDLMERFYDNLWNKDMGKLEALREAQLWMLRDRGPRGLVDPEKNETAPPQRLPPYYWAAFILSGDWR
jgi:CHAT domain-containing protein